MGKRKNTKWTMGPTDFSGTPIPPELAGQTRVYFMPATIDPAVGEEVLIFILDPSLKKKEMAKLGGLRVDLATGMVPTRAGPVGYALFVIPNPSGDAEPFRAYEMFFDPQNQNHLLPYQLLADQSHWHYFVVGRGLKVLNVAEFENVFSLGRVLPEIVEKAGTMASAGFHRALAIVQAEFTLADLWNAAVSGKAPADPEPSPDGLGIADHILLTIARDDVEAGDVTQVADFFQALDRESDGGKAYFGCVDLSVSGYDHDPRAVYVVPEVRRWFAQLLGAVPDIMFFVSTKGTTPKLIMLCTVPIEEVKGKGIRLSPEGVQAFMNFAFAGINHRMREVGLDPRGPDSQALTSGLMKALGP